MKESPQRRISSATSCV